MKQSYATVKVKEPVAKRMRDYSDKTGISQAFILAAAVTEWLDKQSKKSR